MGFFWGLLKKSYRSEAKNPSLKPVQLCFDGGGEMLVAKGVT